MFGHLADWQTVCSFCSVTSFISSPYLGPPGIFIFSQAGLRPPGGEGDNTRSLSDNVISTHNSSTKMRGFHDEDNGFILNARFGFASARARRGRAESDCLRTALRDLCASPRPQR